MLRRVLFIATGLWSVLVFMILWRSRQQLTSPSPIVVPSTATRRSMLNLSDMEETYRFLFHKYRVGLAKKDAGIQYEVLQSGVHQRGTVFVHLHCYDLDRFEQLYGALMPLLRKCFVVITCCVLSDPRRAKLKFRKEALLRIPNKGMDVGAKFCAVHFLRNNSSIQARDLVLFLHSKSDVRQRVQLFEWYVNQLSLLVELSPPFSDNPRTGGIFSPYLVTHQPGWRKNTNNMGDLIKYWKLENDYFYFPIGNCFFLHMDMAIELYGEDTLYQVLNTPTSLDLGWFFEYYAGQGLVKMKDKEALLDALRRGEIALNNLHLGTGHAGLADSMIEHAFERLIFLVLRKNNRVGIFDVATEPLAVQWQLQYSNNSLALNLISKSREPLNNHDFEYRYFAESSKYERVAVLALTTESSMQNTQSLLQHLSEIAYDIVVVAEERDCIDEIEDVELFIINNELTDAQCQEYSKMYDHGTDLSELSAARLRSHYRRHGVRARRFLPGTLASIFSLVSKQPIPQQYRNGLRFALYSLHYRYTDYILCDYKAVLQFDLASYAMAFERSSEVTMIKNRADDTSSFLLRLNAVGATKAASAFADKVEAFNGLDDRLLLHFENVTKVGVDKLK